MKEDLLIRWCNIQYETLSYIEKRMRSASRYVDCRDLSRTLNIKRGAADSRLRRYTAKGWLKEQIVEGERKYVMKMDGLERLQWLEHMQTKVSKKDFKRLLEKEGIELSEWFEEV